MNTDERILVTGAAGFIGSNLLARLEADGFTNIVACDYLGSDNIKWRNVAKRSQVEFTSPDSLLSDLRQRRFDAIIHLGAISSTTATDADEILAVNYRLPIDLHEYCRIHGKRFIYASSAATYGNGEAGFDDRCDMEYLSSLCPLNLYGWSKNLFDKYLSRRGAFTSKAEASVAGLKFFNVYGPNEYHKGTQKSVIPSFYWQATNTDKIDLFRSNTPSVPDGEQKRDFVNVTDCVDVIVWMLHHTEARGLFNVGTGQPVSFARVAAITAQAAGSDAAINFIDMPESIRLQYQNYTCADITRLRSVGYDRQFTDAQEGITEYITHYLSQPDKFK
ncbi:MAG: ADP-glyceromanno-heptose 6-epimerase [Muribaculaceae bacterium]|nr:ADP-glyceromanno-heptose 6-epimerase [Muribaculaceae bacterium]